MSFIRWNLKRALFSALFLFMPSCTPEKSLWERENVVTGHPCFDSTRQLFPADSIFLNLALEIIRTCNEDRVYINVYGLPLKAIEGKVKVLYTIDGQEHVTLGDLFAGEQRVLLPAEAGAEIISALSNCQEVFIETGRYKATVKQF